MRVSARRGGSANSARGCQRARRHLAVGVLRHLAHFVGRDIARDHQDGVVGRIVMIVEILRRDAVDAAHFLGPADHRPAIGMGQMQRRLASARPSAPGARCRPACGALPAPHRARSRHWNRTGRDWPGGRPPASSPAAAGPWRSARRRRCSRGSVKALFSPPFLAMVWAEGVARHGLGAAEHHMLEEMGQARNARRIVHRADLEPQHLGDDRGAVIGDHQHLHAVGQRELESVVAGLAGIGRRRLGQLGAIGGIGRLRASRRRHSSAAHAAASRS